MSQTQKQTESPFLSLQEACDYLKLKPATLYKYSSQRVITHYKLRGRKIYFRKEDLEKFILNENNLVKSQRQIESEALSDYITQN